MNASCGGRRACVRKQGRPRFCSANEIVIFLLAVACIICSFCITYMCICNFPHPLLGEREGDELGCCIFWLVAHGLGKSCVEEAL